MPLGSVQQYRVYLRAGWDQPWQLDTAALAINGESQGRLFCDEFTLCAAPEMPTAALTWNYGRILPFGKQAFRNVTTTSLLNWYVKIVLDQPGGRAPHEWVGVIKREVNSRRGGAQPSGMQMYQAFGLECLLQQERLDRSKILKPDATFEWIGRAIGFNMGGGEGQHGRLIGNCSTLAGLDDALVFCDRLDQAQLWNAYTIVDYLLTYMTPGDAADGEIIPFRIDPAYADQLHSLDWWKPQLSAHGKSIKELLDSILHRQRLMSYRLRVVDDVVYLQPFTFTEADVNLPSERTILKNPWLMALDFDQDHFVKQATLVREAQAQYDVVRTVGDPVGVVFSPFEEIISTDWNTDLTTTYNSGCTNADALTAANSDSTLLSRLHRAYRNTDRLKRVYGYFRIDNTWDGKCDGEIVVITPESEVGDIHLDTFWHPGLRIEPYLPLKNWVDYEEISGNLNDTVPDGALPDYRRPFVVAHKPVESESDTKHYFYLDKPELFDHYGDHPESAVRMWACNVRPQDDSFGLEITVSGAPQHVIAKDEFVAIDDADEADFAAELRWQDFIATVYVRLDKQCYGQYPEIIPPIPVDVLRELVIEIPGKRLDYVVPKTVVEIDEDGSLIRNIDGGFLEDDRAELKDVARLTYEWYSKQRLALDVTVHALDTLGVDVGTLVTDFGSGANFEAVNSVVTQLRFDLRTSSHSLRTQFGELDFRGL